MLLENWCNLRARLNGFKHLTNIRSTNVEQMLGKSWTNVEWMKFLYTAHVTKSHGGLQFYEVRSDFTIGPCWTDCSNGFNTIQHFWEQRKCWIDVEWKFQPIQIWFKPLSICFQHSLHFSTMFNNLFKRPRHLVQQSVELMLKQMLKPFKRALTQPINQSMNIFMTILRRPYLDFPIIDDVHLPSWK